MTPEDYEVRFTLRSLLSSEVWNEIRGFSEADLAAAELKQGYPGPHQRLGDYYVRELRREGTDRRQVVVFEVVGTGRVERLARTRFERQVRPA